MSPPTTTSTRCRSPSSTSGPRIFDGQLTSLGQDLYREYVRLKDFSGSTAADMQVGSLADLRRLIDEIKKLSQFVDEETPTNLRPAGSEPRTGGLPTPKPEDAARGGAAVATGGVSLFIEWAFNELIKAGNRPVRVTWAEFPLKLNEGRGNIIELRPPEQNALPRGTVEIVLETDAQLVQEEDLLPAVGSRQPAARLQRGPAELWRRSWSHRPVWC